MLLPSGFTGPKETVPEKSCAWTKATGFHRSFVRGDDMSARSWDGQALLGRLPETER